MRGMKIVLLGSLLFAACAGHAYADGAAATAVFGGTVTQAPEDNAFGVVVGSPIQGEIFFNDYPPSPCFTATGCLDSTFSIEMTIGENPGGIHYFLNTLGVMDDSTVVDFGALAGIHIESFPPAPCTIGTPGCGPFPDLSLAGNQFFTTDCAAGAVCGTLDFSDSQITATPEPSTLSLYGVGLFGLIWLSLKKAAA